MTGVAVDRVARPWVFRFHLGEASTLDGVRRGQEAVRGVGAFEVRRGATPTARLLCVLLRAPRRASAVPIQVEIRRQGGEERWTRIIGDRRYTSTQVPAGRSAPGVDLVRERTGPLELVFLRAVDGDGLRYRQARAALRLGPLRLPIPRPVAPSVRADVRARGDRAFFVRLEAHVLGRPLYSYSGVVEEA